MSTDPTAEPVVALGARQRPTGRTDLVQVVMTEEARDVIDGHVAEDTSAESGGVLAGTYDEHTHRVRVIAAVPARLAVGAVSNLTFTHEAWDEVSSVMAAEHPDLRMVGWYHSHPHFGIFLSEYDLFIHRNFFAEPWQVAYVVDPLLGRAGFFGWRDGAIEQHTSWLVRAHRGARSVPPSPQRSDGAAAAPLTVTRPRHLHLALAALVLGVVAFVAGFVLHRPSAAASTKATTMFAEAGLSGRRSVTITGASGTVVVSVTNTGPRPSRPATVGRCAPLYLTTGAPGAARGGPGASFSYTCDVSALAAGRTLTFAFSGTSEQVLQAASAPTPVIEVRTDRNAVST